MKIPKKQGITVGANKSQGRKSLSCFLVLIAVLILLSTGRAGAFSLGASPGNVNFRDVLRGGYAEDVVRISTNSDSNVTLTIDILGDKKDWIKISPASGSAVISRTSPLMLKVMTTPAMDAANGEYTALIRIKASESSKIKGKMGSVALTSILLKVNIGITGKEMRRCLLRGATINDVEEGYPIELTGRIINKGNVRIKPKIYLDVWDQEQENIVLSKTFYGDEILPTTGRDFLERINHNLTRGQYWAYIRTADCEGRRVLTFNVVKEGEIVDRGTLETLSSKVWAYAGELVRISALFRNRGPRSVKARFEGQVSLNNKIVELLNSETQIVPSGEEGALIVYFRPKKAGRYEITGRVRYNDKVTFEKGTVINVNYPPGYRTRSVWFRVIPIVIYLLLLLIIILLIRKIKKGYDER